MPRKSEMLSAKSETRSRSQESASTEAKSGWNEPAYRDSSQDASSTRMSSASFIRNFWLEQMHAVPAVKATLTSGASAVASAAVSRVTSSGLGRLYPAGAFSTVESSSTRLTSFSVDAILRSSRTNGTGSTEEGYCRWENEHRDRTNKCQSLGLPPRGECCLRRNWKHHRASDIDN